MEMHTLKKAVLYISAAAILGLVLILVPLMTIRAQNEYNSGFLSVQSVPPRMEALNGRTAYDVNVASSWFTEVGLLAISFMVASITYLLFRRRTTRSIIRNIQYRTNFSTITF
jgi:hypothetical protein